MRIVFAKADPTLRDVLTLTKLAEQLGWVPQLQEGNDPDRPPVKAHPQQTPAKLKRNASRATRRDPVVRSPVGQRMNDYILRIYQGRGPNAQANAFELAKAVNGLAAQDGREFVESGVTAALSNLAREGLLAHVGPSLYQLTAKGAKFKVPENPGAAAKPQHLPSRPRSA